MNLGVGSFVLGAGRGYRWGASDDDTEGVSSPHEEERYCRQRHAKTEQDGRGDVDVDGMEIPGGVEKGTSGGGALTT